MAFESKEARPPYVTFGVKAVEDRTASQAEGRAVMKDVHFAYITPHGSKDRTERVVAEWFPILEEAVSQERMPTAWVKAYKDAYAAWKDGRELPLSGSPIANWPLLTPAQIENMRSIGVKTIEDLAAANEELISRLGMGGRILVDKAKTWLQTSGGETGKAVERISSLEAQNAQLLTTNAEMAEALDLLKRDMKVLQAAAKEAASA